MVNLYLHFNLELFVTWTVWLTSLSRHFTFIFRLAQCREEISKSLTINSAIDLDPLGVAHEVLVALDALTLLVVGLEAAEVTNIAAAKDVLEVP